MNEGSKITYILDDAISIDAKMKKKRYENPNTTYWKDYFYYELYA
jgi:hypothetical protein